MFFYVDALISSMSLNFSTYSFKATDSSFVVFVFSFCSVASLAALRVTFPHRDTAHTQLSVLNSSPPVSKVSS